MSNSEDLAAAKQVEQLITELRLQQAQEPGFDLAKSIQAHDLTSHILKPLLEQLTAESWLSTDQQSDLQDLLATSHSDPTHDLPSTKDVVVPHRRTVQESESDLVAYSVTLPTGGVPFSNAQRLELPCTLDDYELVEEIGRGGMGVVYKARQLSLNRWVALKMIRSGILASEGDVQRFHHEAEAAGKLQHPNIVQIHQVGDLQGFHYFSMEYVDGRDLSQISRTETLNNREIAKYVKSAAEAIEHAHHAGIIHRDIKPANIIVDRSKRVLVTDFGLAKNIKDDHDLTVTGTSIGTPSYMSPEQASGATEFSATTDVYSLGAVLYELLTGEPPFRGASLVDTMLAVIHQEPTPPESLKPNVDRQLSAVAMKCLQKEPSERYQTAAELANDLQRYLDGSSVQAKDAGAFKKAWIWLQDVPVIGALSGRRVTHPTRTHHIFQAALLASAFGLFLYLFAFAFHTPAGDSQEEPYPKTIRIASGIEGGEYERFSNALRKQLAQIHTTAPVIETAGSLENVDMLTTQGADVALLQAAALRTVRGELSVVCPLYQEQVYVLVPQSSMIRNVSELDGKKVLVGVAGSGMSLTAQQLFDRLEISPVETIEKSFLELENEQANAAIVTSGTSHSVFLQFLQSHSVRLVSFSEDELDAMTSSPLFKEKQIQSAAGDSINTVQTTTFLAVRSSASSEFVLDLLTVLYDSSDWATEFDLISRRSAREWVVNYHRAAAQFFADP